MFRRWLIRGFLLFLLTLLVAGWGVSTVRSMRWVRSYHWDIVFCEVSDGAVVFSWVRRAYEPDGWNWESYRHRFRVLDTDFFWVLDSTESPDNHFSFVSLAGFQYRHHIHRIGSGPPRNVVGVGVPFWFLLVVTGGGVVWVWRKTRPRIDPARAFPVELAGRR